MTVTAIASDNFRDRLAVGIDTERRIRAELERRGWAVAPYGQGVLAEPIRRALKLTDCRRRWDPDLIAANGSTVCQIEVKESIRRAGAGTYAISRKSLRAALEMWAGDDLPFYYVFGNLGVATPADIMRFCGLARIGDVAGAYVVFDAGDPRPFDEVFGLPLHIAGAA